MTFDAVIDFLALIGAACCVYWTIIGLRGVRRWTAPPRTAPSGAQTAQRASSAQAPALPQQGSPEIPADHLAVLAAAVAALGAGFKVVHIAEAAVARDWVTEGRRAHQASHQTSRRSR